MEKSEKGPGKTNSSVPDIVFYQLTMDKDERVIGFMENDSEEQFGKLARKGGEILLPGVFPQKATRLPDDLTKASEGHPRKGKIQVRVDIPTSDTELETLLFYGGSSAELRYLGKEDGRKSVTERKSIASSDSRYSKSETCRCCEPSEEIIHADASEVVLQTEQLTDVTANNSAGKIPEEGCGRERTGQPRLLQEVTPAAGVGGCVRLSDNK